MEPFWGSGCPFLPSAPPQGTFVGAFRAGENPSASWMGVQVGVAAKEHKALRPMFQPDLLNGCMGRGRGYSLEMGPAVGRVRPTLQLQLPAGLGPWLWSPCPGPHFA